MKFFLTKTNLSQNNPVYFHLLKQTARFEKYDTYQSKLTTG